MVRRRSSAPLIVPLVLYHGAQPWQHELEFAELFTDAVPQWRWVPRFEHLLVDLAQQSAESVPGALAARLAQVAMMAASGRRGRNCWNRRRG